jgi:RecA-family ATPase
MREIPWCPQCSPVYVNGAWLDKQSFADLSYAVPGVIPEGATLFVGPPKAGKSWVMLGLALAVASGGVALGALPVGSARPVLLLALEDGDRRLQSRCRALLGDDPIPDGLDYMTRLDHRPVTEVVGAWLDIHGHRNPLVALDTLGKCLPPNRTGESAYSRDYRIGTGLKRLTDDHPGAALVVVHHDRKASADDYVDAVSGTHGLAGAADSVIVLDRPRRN